MDINSRNIVATNGKEIEMPIITHCELNDDGWMVIVDEIKEFGDLYQRFYEYDSKSQEYALHTRINHPHKQINSISLGGSYCISCGDFEAKVWKLDNNLWKLDNVFEYKGLQPIKCKIQGNLVAISFANIVTVWDLEQGILLRTMSFGYTSNVLNLCFCGDYIIGSDNNLLQVWQHENGNLINSCVEYDYKGDTIG